jgi:hypothetical protein
MALISRGRHAGRTGAGVAAVLLAGGLLTACGSSGGSGSASASTVLLVGTYKGAAGQYKSIQAAVDAAKPGDWILVAPGDYHEMDDLQHPSTNSAHGEMGGVLITTPNIHLRGMNRNTVIVDGTKAGPAPACSNDSAEQTYGATGSDGKPVGRNGILVWKADDVSVENLTVCNFMAGTGDSGNGVWWNGGADSGQIGLHHYTGAYLTATSSFFASDTSAAEYGIFSSNSQGPARWDHVYASNFNDSGMYVGACQQVCDVTIDHAWMEFSALGYSGTNSGGQIVIENSQFDHNKEGLDTNSQIEGDPPGPQDGACPNNGTSPITHTHSCWVFMHNDVHDNNNPNVPKAGEAGLGPTGTGITISGGRNDTVMDNTFADNGAWGLLFIPWPDSGTPQMGQTCAGVQGTENALLGCIIETQSDALLHNTFSHNGYFGNPTNADFGQLMSAEGQPRNCFAANAAPLGSTPPDLETTQPTCGLPYSGPTGTGPLFTQLVCDSGLLPCPAATTYPKFTGVVMHPLPHGLATMPNPCAGVPSNPWCKSG